MPKVRKIVILALAFCAVWVAFVIFSSWPMGKGYYLRSHATLGRNINISEPRYIIPREFVFPSVLGESLGLLPFRDPHYYGLDPIQFEVDYDGTKKLVIAQGFEVNPRFSKPQNKKSLLAISVDENVSKIDLGDVCFHCWFSSGQLFALGQTPSKLVFLVFRPYEESKQHAFVPIDLPFGSSPIAEVHLTETEEAEKLLSEIKGFSQGDGFLIGVCRSRSKALWEFLEIKFNFDCSVRVEW
ncbi:MAG: hypothetical protein ACRBBQ_04130 [Cognatishimia sp.]